MIIKNIKKNCENNLELQGLESEKRMEFYLERYFKDKEDIFVFNDLYVENNGDISQIDHLVLFKYGIFIIESKSCLGEIFFNERDEWKRKTGSNYSGFPSPIKQVERQFKVLVDDFNKHDKEIYDIMLIKKQRSYGGRLQIKLVAIDDRAIIVRDNNHNNFNDIVMKSDQVCEYILSIINKFKDLPPFLFRKDEFLIPEFRNHEIKKMIDHLLVKDLKIRETKLNNNENIQKKDDNHEKLNNKKQIRENKCFSCNTDHSMEIKYGRYGYYFSCKHCKNNSNIKETCPSCLSKSTKLKKFKEHYYLDCSCGVNKLYFINN